MVPDVRICPPMTARLGTPAWVARVALAELCAAAGCGPAQDVPVLHGRWPRQGWRCRSAL